MRNNTALSSIALILILVTLFSCTTDQMARGGNGAKEIIASKGAPAAIGPYSQAVLVNDTLYLSGQIAIDPRTGKLVQEGIEGETRQVLANMKAVLEEAGMQFADVVQAQIFLKDLDHYGLVNKIYSEYFEKAPPARACVEVARLPKDVPTGSRKWRIII